MIVVTEGDPVPTQVLARVDGVLLAEVRGVSRGDRNGAYAVATGPGRDDLPAGFQPARLTRDEAEDLLNEMRALHRPTEREIRVLRNKARTPHAGSTGHGDGTGAVLTNALLSGALSWLDMLEDGWTVVSADGDRTGLLRPSYSDGDRPTSAESANAVGAVLAVHSAAVEWADPGEVFNPPQALAASRFDGDFAAAMTAVERAARELVEGGTPPVGWLAGWPVDVLRAVHADRRRLVGVWRSRRAERLSDWVRRSVPSRQGGSS